MVFLAIRRTELALLADHARRAGVESPRRAHGARHRCAEGVWAEADGRHCEICDVMYGLSVEETRTDVKFASD